MIRKKLVVLLFLIISPLSLSGQDSSKRQKELESRRIKLQNEIEKINDILFSKMKTQKVALTRVEDIQIKIEVRNQIIDINEEQINFLKKNISSNQATIQKNNKSLKRVKENYAEMIQKGHRSKSLQNRMMFLFSSQSFWQAYQRIEYMKQYNTYRKNQAQEIIQKTEELKRLNETLSLEKNKKESLVKQNVQIETELKEERSQQQIMIRNLKKQQKSLASQIRKKQRETDKIDKEIDRIIREAIAASNKASGKANAGTFFMTPEVKLNGENFLANKGRLPWPTSQGVVVQKFGVQPHPIVKTAIIKNIGITIATRPQSKIRAVFEGEVLTVLKFSGSNPTVLIQHGNHVTSYKNLGKVYVKKGDKVETKQAIGEVFTNKQSGKTTFQFGVYLHSKPQNPKGWLYEL